MFSSSLYSVATNTERRVLMASTHSRALRPFPSKGISRSNPLKPVLVKSDGRLNFSAGGAILSPSPSITAACSNVFVKDFVSDLAS